MDALHWQLRYLESNYALLWRAFNMEYPPPFSRTEALFVYGACFNYTGNETQHMTHMSECPCSSASPG
ncbi:hypothetical protein KIN20_000007 [Parelaphostrongylus tenuis]|uniref:Uncharacterized protein n=1 Tax=Parelaphostrongylus tenuis TaxID=148309 RepID=A0AAD5MD16_PARTN|nr:hypothetical protein KIN20_000007 [Parelaphostrongylus tenuis]